MTESKNIEAAAFRVVFVVLATLLGIWLVYTLQSLIVSLIFALTLASAIAPVAEWGEERKISRAIMVLGVYLCVGLVYAVVAMALVPAVKSQAVQLYSNLPIYLAGASDWFESVKGIAGEQAKDIHAQDFLQNFATSLGHKTLDATAGLLGLILNGLLVMFLTAYFVIQADAIWRKLLMWVPGKHRNLLAGLIRPLSQRMGGYVRGQLLVSLAVSLFLTIGLTTLRVNYSLILGVLAGLLNLVPFVGSLAACVFAVVVAANQNIWLAGATLCLFACEQWVESNFIVPFFLGRHVELHPLIVLFAILIGATLMGVPGALVAVPLTSAALFLAQEFYLKPMQTNGSATAGGDTVISETGSAPSATAQEIFSAGASSAAGQDIVRLDVYNAALHHPSLTVTERNAQSITTGENAHESSDVCDGSNGHGNGNGKPKQPVSDSDLQSQEVADSIN
jgi:predicted PurR-regulated permease PerM